VELAAVNALGESGFVERFGGVFEHSPWVAQRAWAERPFASLHALHQAMMRTVAQAASDEQLALIRAHPELAGAEAREGTLSADSSSEQGRLGFAALSKDEFSLMTRMNREYRQKFGFPCIVALRLHATRESVMAEIEQRLANDPSTEMQHALEQIGHITRGRLAKILNG
jgi:OHCU decarboxylase